MGLTDRGTCVASRGSRTWYYLQGEWRLVAGVVGGSIAWFVEVAYLRHILTVLYLKKTFFEALDFDTEHVFVINSCTASLLFPA